MSALQQRKLTCVIQDALRAASVGDARQGGSTSLTNISSDDVDTWEFINHLSPAWWWWLNH